jgi:hypothetical protein
MRRLGDHDIDFAQIASEFAAKFKREFTGGNGEYLTARHPKHRRQSISKRNRHHAAKERLAPNQDHVRTFLGYRRDEGRPYPTRLDFRILVRLGDARVVVKVRNLVPDDAKFRMGMGEVVSP